MIEAKGGEIHVGAFVLRVGSPAGALIGAAAREVRSRPVPRRAPLRALPPPVLAFFGRTGEIEAAAAEIATGGSVEFFAGEGAGKSALLAYLAHHVSPASLPDGTVHLPARRATFEDVVQAVHDALFEAATRVKVTAAQLRDRAGASRGAAAPRALVLIDDPELEPEQVEALVLAVPSSAFVFASPERRLWSVGRAIPLEPLDAPDAIALFERALGRPLRSDEHGIMDALGGRPLSILLAAGLLRAGGLTAAEIGGRSAGGRETIESLGVGALEGQELAMAAALAAVGGLDAELDELAAISGVADPRAALDGLARRGAARRAGERFGMAATVAAEVARRVDLGVFEGRAAAHWAARAASLGTDHGWVATRTPLVLEVLERALAVRRWDEALEIARGADGALALSGRWGAWGRALELAHQAARQRHRPEAEAWALHQRGTRALCLGELEAAREHLEKAVALREAIGDTEGAAASRHNLEHVPGAPVVVAPAPDVPAAAPPAAMSPWFLLAMGLALAALVIVVLLAVRREDGAGPGGAIAVDADAIDHGAQAVGTRGETRTTVVENRSGGPITLTAVRIMGAAAGEYFMVQDECTGRVLPPGGTCSIRTAFVPGGTGPRVAELALVDSGGETRTVTLRGTGTDAVEPGTEGEPSAGRAGRAVPGGATSTRVEFGEQEIGRVSGALPVTFVNSGPSPVQLAVRLGGPGGEFRIAGDGCTSRVVPPGRSCIVEVAFRPRVAGARGAVLVLRDIATNESWAVAVVGTGVAAAAPVAEPPAARGVPEGYPLEGPDRIVFGAQRPGTRSQVQRITLQNRVQDSVRVSSARVAGIAASSFGIGGDRCTGMLLRPGDWCTVDVWFQPADLGEKRASLVVRDGTGAVGREVVLAGMGG